MTNKQLCKKFIELHRKNVKMLDLISNNEEAMNEIGLSVCYDINPVIIVDQISFLIHQDDCNFKATPVIIYED